MGDFKPIVMEADVYECRQLEKYLGNELAWVKYSSEWEEYTYKHNSLLWEVSSSDSLPQPFPYQEGKLFEDVTHVFCLLWTIDIRKGIMKSLISALNTFDCTSLCQSSRPQLCRWKAS